MARSGRPVTRDEAVGYRRRPDTPLGVDSTQEWEQLLRSSGYPDHRPASSTNGGVPARRTVTITGRGAEAYAWRNGTTPSRARRRTQVKRHQRPGFRPDRAAFWAVLLGVLLILVAAVSAHAAVLAAGHGLPLH
jgi:hypothetical protein